MNKDHVSGRILEILKQVAPDADVGHLKADHSFRDQLDLDSVDFLNFVLALEAGLDVHIPDADHMKLSTLAGCIDYLGRTSAKAAPAEVLHG